MFIRTIANQKSNTTNAGLRPSKLPSDIPNDGTSKTFAVCYKGNTGEYTANWQSISMQKTMPPKKTGRKRCLYELTGIQGNTQPQNTNISYIYK